MEEKKKPNLSILFIIAIIIIIIMGLFIYKLYNDKISMKNSIEELNDKISKIDGANIQEETTNKNEKQNTNKLETLNTDSDLVKRLYNYVAKFSYYDELIAYQSEKVTEKNMNNSLKLLTVFNNLGKNDATRVEYKYESEEIPKREHIIYAKDVVENKAKEIFGKDVKIVHQDASPYDSQEIKYQNDVEIERTEVSSVVLEEPVNKIVQVRAKQTTSRSSSGRTYISGSVAEYQAYARARCSAYGWSTADFNCLVALWNKESKWNPNAYNSGSGAYGIPQALPASKMATAGTDYRTNYKTQINWGLSYISSRYGSPSAAWSHSKSKGWY